MQKVSLIYLFRFDLRNKAYRYIHIYVSDQAGDLLRHQIPPMLISPNKFSSRAEDLVLEGYSTLSCATAATVTLSGSLFPLRLLLYIDRQW